MGDEDTMGGACTGERRFAGVGGVGEIEVAAGSFPAKLPWSDFFRASSTSVARVTDGEAGLWVDSCVGVGCWMLTVLPDTCMEVEGLETGREIPPTLGTVVAVTIPRGIVEVAAEKNKQINNINKNQETVK